jgi:hypothetical protein
MFYIVCRRLIGLIFNAFVVVRVLLDECGSGSRRYAAVRNTDSDLPLKPW